MITAIQRAARCGALQLSTGETNMSEKRRKEQIGNAVIMAARKILAEGEKEGTEATNLYQFADYIVRNLEPAPGSPEEEIARIIKKATREAQAERSGNNQGERSESAAAANVSILPEQLVVSMAALQIIRRPADVVKELIENSLDAGARSISVEIIGAGSELIAVTDD